MKKGAHESQELIGIKPLRLDLLTTDTVKMYLNDNGEFLFDRFCNADVS